MTHSEKTSENYDLSKCRVFNKFRGNVPHMYIPSGRNALLE
jgi:hypothetical protein